MAEKKEKKYVAASSESKRNAEGTVTRKVKEAQPVPVSITTIASKSISKL